VNRIGMVATALREMRKRPQVLPKWVVEGARVQWMGEGRHHVYTVAYVLRRSHRWYFNGERTLPGGSKEKRGFHQETGRRYWRKARA